MAMVEVPTFDKFMNPTIQALKELGLGIVTEVVRSEKVTINHKWFAGI